MELDRLDSGSLEKRLIFGPRGALCILPPQTKLNRLMRRMYQYQLSLLRQGASFLAGAVFPFEVGEDVRFGVPFGAKLAGDEQRGLIGVMG